MSNTYYLRTKLPKKKFESLKFFINKHNCNGFHVFLLGLVLKALHIPELRLFLFSWHSLFYKTAGSVISSSATLTWKKKCAH
jgi:hypothetical protein